MDIKLNKYKCVEIGQARFDHVIIILKIYRYSYSEKTSKQIEDAIELLENHEYDFSSHQKPDQ